MSTPLIIWGMAFVLYAIFWWWYVGFRRPLSEDEVEEYLNKLKQFEGYKNRDLSGLRRFLESDTGKSFAMVNSIVLKKTPLMVPGVKKGESSREVLMNYAKPFMKMMLKRGGIAIFQGQVAGRSFDVLNIENALHWEISGINRFRSRRDFIEILIQPEFHKRHALKFASLEKSIAYPVDPWFQLGGFATVVGLALALTAALLHIFLG